MTNKSHERAPQAKTYRSEPMRLLDPAKVRNARLEHGWSEATFASALGVAPAVVRRLEHGREQKYFTLAFVRDVAHLLGRTVAELMPEPAVDDEHDPDTMAPGDAAVVGAVLATARVSLSIDQLAASFGWTLERILLALDELELRAPATGQRLAWWQENAVQLVPAEVPAATLQAVSQATIAEGGVDLLETQVIEKLCSGPRKAVTAGFNRFALTRLRAGGLIDTSASAKGSASAPGSEAPRLTELARFNLVLDD